MVRDPQYDALFRGLQREALANRVRNSLMRQNQREDVRRQQYAEGIQTTRDLVNRFGSRVGSQLAGNTRLRNAVASGDSTVSLARGNNTSQYVGYADMSSMTDADGNKQYDDRAVTFSPEDRQWLRDVISARQRGGGVPAARVADQRRQEEAAAYQRRAALDQARREAMYEREQADRQFAQEALEAERDYGIRSLQAQVLADAVRRGQQTTEGEPIPREQTTVVGPGETAIRGGRAIGRNMTPTQEELQTVERHFDDLASNAGGSRMFRRLDDEGNTIEEVTVTQILEGAREAMIRDGLSAMEAIQFIHDKFNLEPIPKGSSASSLEEVAQQVRDAGKDNP